MLVGGDGGYIYSWARKPVLRGLERFKCVGLLWDGIFWSCRLVGYSLVIYDEAYSYVYLLRNSTSSNINLCRICFTPVIVPNRHLRHSPVNYI